MRWRKANVLIGLGHSGGLGAEGRDFAKKMRMLKLGEFFISMTLMFFSINVL